MFDHPSLLSCIHAWDKTLCISKQYNLTPIPLTMLPKKIEGAKNHIINPKARVLGSSKHLK